MENTGWTIEQTKRLFELCSQVQAQGKGLRAAFIQAASDFGRKPNSVRNYYYAHLKTFNLIPEVSRNLGITVVPRQAAGFKTFSGDEAERLVSTILMQQANGRSVRKITQELGGGDKSLTLRLQNKYRSIIFGRRKAAENIMRKLREQKITFYNPYTKKTVEAGVEAPADPETLIDNISAITAALGDEQVKSLFAALARLAGLAAEKSAGADADSLRLEVAKKNRQIAELQEKFSVLNKLSGVK